MNETPPPLPTQIGPYKIVEQIGKGGMGEVYLAFDTVCLRNIALKKVRADLIEHKQIQKRFLKEAHITAKLTHPSIVPIYTIHKERGEIYYTMPFVEGKTLKKLLKEAKQMEKESPSAVHSFASISLLLRIFLSLCQAIAYAHKNGVLHRDIKPENVMIGKYGEVMILDWGLARLIDDKSEEEIIPYETSGVSLAGVTRLGKVVGTVNYMAPERIKGSPAAISTDIYALGVILYQILTLKFPFLRTTLEKCKKKIDQETFPDPVKAAPYRDISTQLVAIVQECMHKDPDKRYKHVEDLIYELESYLEGRAEWYPAADLQTGKKDDWEFQEHVFLSEHMAITRGAGLADWMHIMISQASFSDNVRLDISLRLGVQSHGIGFLLSIPESAERKHLSDGFCLWLGSDQQRTSKLLRSSTEVLHIPEIHLKRHVWYQLRIEKIEHTIRLYINDELKMTYVSHIPLTGTHVGILSRDADFELSRFKVSLAGHSVMVKSLSVPDAFLSHSLYDLALNEYRRIGYSFPGRAEGREALFKAGITLLEKAKAAKEEEKEQLFDKSLQEFEKLHGTPGAPLEYLGKAIVYHTRKEYSEEIKCFELAFRKFPFHPLLYLLHEQVLYRMHEYSKIHRKATYEFILIALRHHPHIIKDPSAKRLLISLQKHWEALPFLSSRSILSKNETDLRLTLAQTIAFWLNKAFVIEETFSDLLAQNCSPLKLLESLLLLYMMEQEKIAEKLVESLRKEKEEVAKKLHHEFLFLEEISKNDTPLLLSIIQKTKPNYLRYPFCRYLLLLWTQRKLEERDFSSVEKALAALEMHCKKKRELPFLEKLKTLYFLLQKKWAKAGEILHRYSPEELQNEEAPLFLLYGYYLLATEGEALAYLHFSGVADVSYPRSCNLLAFYLTKKISLEGRWGERSFAWEKKALFRQLSIYFELAGESKQAAEWGEKSQKVFLPKDTL